MTEHPSTSMLMSVPCQLAPSACLEAYHMQFPTCVINASHPNCHLEALNAVAALQTWAPKYQCQLIYFVMDSTIAVAIFQAGKGRDSFIHACTQQLWLICAELDITLNMSHIPCEQLTMSIDTLSYWHMGQHYKDCVHSLVQDIGLSK